MTPESKDQQIRWRVINIGLILKREGSGWSKYYIEPDDDLLSIYGVAEDDIYIGGRHGLLLHSQ